MTMLIAVDVGTASVRAGLFTAEGELLARRISPITLARPAAERAEQDGEEIWRAVCEAVRGAREAAGVAPGAVRGLAFDATSCTLVFLDAADRPVSISESGEERWNVLVWMDHRAIAEAERCTATGHRVLRHVGGVMSPEMAVPKLMWVKHHLPERWEATARVFDLADYLGWKATGNNARSQCTLTCKWTYLAHRSPGWQRDFLAEVGIPEMIERADLPERATPVGADLGPLTGKAAAALGLTTGCRVGAGLIDAHAGALGLLGGIAPERPEALDRHLALIAGTSTCHMAMSPEPRQVFGVWGPYYGVVLPDLWLNEGGQPATGALLDHMIAWTAAGAALGEDAHARVLARIEELRREEGEDLAPRLHVLPDFHGNRSPLADPHALGVISGLALDHSFDALCRLYYRTALAVALGTRHVIEALNREGYAIDTLHLAGGHTRNPLLMEFYADATGCRVITPGEQDPVLLGTAVAAARAAGLHPDLAAAAKAMRWPGAVRDPDPATRARHDRDYRAFLAMHEQRRALDALIAGQESALSAAGG